MKIYDFKLRTIDGEEKQLDEYKNKVLLIVNTASKCGFAPQYKELEELYERYGNDKFEILAFPSDQFLNQELGTNSEIKNFCEINFGVTFPIFEKINVKGENIHPLYDYLCKEKSGLFGGAVKWNFTKFLLDSSGKVVGRFSPSTSPLKIQNHIEKLIKEI